MNCCWYTVIACVLLAIVTIALPVGLLLASIWVVILLGVLIA